MSDIQKLNAEELLEISGGREMRKPFMTQIKTDKKFINNEIVNINKEVNN